MIRLVVRVALAAVLAAPGLAAAQAAPPARVLVVPMEDERPAPRPRPRPARRQVRADLGDIEVRGPREDGTVADRALRTDVIGPRALRARGARTVGDALDGHLGVLVGTQAYYDRGAPQGMQLWGCDPRRLLVLVDGRRVIGTADGIVDAAQLGLGDVARIEILRGAASALHGSDAVCGVVHVIRRAPPRRGAVLDALAEYGSLNSHHLRLDVGARPRPSLGLRAGVAVRGQDGFDLDRTTPATDGYASESVQGSLRLAWQPARAWQVRVDLAHAAERRRGVLSDAVPGMTAQVWENRFLIQRPSTALTVRWDPRPGAHLLARLYHEGYLAEHRQQLVDGLDRRSRLTWQSYLNATVRGQVLLGTWNLLAGGVEVGHESLDIDRADTTVNRRGEILDTAAAEVDGRTATVVEAFVQDELSPWRALTVVPGLRYTWHDRFGHQATPKLSVLVDPRPEVRLRLAYGQGFRSPTLKNLYYRFDHADLGFPLIIEGNPDLRPETSHGATASVEVRPRRGLLLAAGGAYTYYRNLIERGEVLLVDSSFVSRLENVGTAHTATFDLGADAALGRYVGLMAGYVFLWSRAEDTGKALINRPAHQVKTELRFRHARWGLSATVALTWQSEVFVNAANTRTSPGYPVLNAWIEQRLYRGLHAYLRGLNLTNSRRSGADPLDLRPQPGWQLLGGVRYRLAQR